MSTIEETLRALLEARPASADRYDEGFRAGYDTARKELETAIHKILQSPAAPSPPKTSSPPPPRTTTSAPSSDARRLPAPEKDKMVLSYLAKHPNLRYKDIARDLTRYVATRVYALVERGEVVKHADGSFTLANSTRSGDDNDNIH